MYSPSKETFFKKIYESNNDLEYYHSSDIDLGGFVIFERLKNNIIHTLKPYKMDIDTFYNYRESWINTEIDYEEKLKQKLLDKKFAEFYKVINAMLKEHAKLEQEAFLIFK